MPVHSYTEPDFEPIAYDGLGSNPSYAVPDPTEGGPYGPDAWSPTLTNGVNGIPDAHRLGTVPEVESRETPDRPRLLWWLRGRDRNARESVATPAGQMQDIKGVKRTVAPDPRWNPAVNDRYTATLSPTNAGYVRLMTGRVPRNLSGEHMSMADHKRHPGEIFGMAPPRSPRNTFRLDVPPMDTDIVDMPPDIDYTSNEVYTIPVTAPSSRAHRLG